MPEVNGRFVPEGHADALAAGAAVADDYAEDMAEAVAEDDEEE